MTPTPAPEPVLLWQLGRVSTAGNTIEFMDGTVRSLNPASNNPPTTYKWENRPHGIGGAYEVCAIDGGLVTYNPTGGEPVVFGFRQIVPNAPGCCAITLDPLK